MFSSRLISVSSYRLSRQLVTAVVHEQKWQLITRINRRRTLQILDLKCIKRAGNTKIFKIRKSLPSKSCLHFCLGWILTEKIPSNNIRAAPFVIHSSPSESKRISLSESASSHIGMAPSFQKSNTDNFPLELTNNFVLLATASTWENRARETWNSFLIKLKLNLGFTLI